MAQIVDKDTRIIDVDFGTLRTNVGRTALSGDPTSVTLDLNGTSDLLTSVPAGQPCI